MFFSDSDIAPVSLCVSIKHNPRFFLWVFPAHSRSLSSFQPHAHPTSYPIPFTHPSPPIYSLCSRREFVCKHQPTFSLFVCHSAIRSKGHSHTLLQLTLRLLACRLSLDLHVLTFPRQKVYHSNSYVGPPPLLPFSPSLLHTFCILLAFHLFYFNHNFHFYHSSFIFTCIPLHQRSTLLLA